MKYVLKDGIQISKEWLFENILPSIRKYYKNDTRLCSVLAFRPFPPLVAYSRSEALEHAGHVRSLPLSFGFISSGHVAWLVSSVVDLSFPKGVARARPLYAHARCTL